MDRATALAYVSRLFDAAAAGDVLWGDDEIIERFLAQCSRTGSQETREGYGRNQSVSGLALDHGTGSAAAGSHAATG